MCKISYVNVMRSNILKMAFREAYDVRSSYGGDSIKIF